MSTISKWAKRGIWGLVVIGGGLLGAAAWHYWPRHHSFYSDGTDIRQPLGSVSPRDILWQPPKPLAESINTDGDDYEPRITADGLTLYFVRGKAGKNADLYVAAKTNEGWGEPQPLSALNSEYDDLGPEPSFDGSALYFYSNRPGGLGGYDLWVSRQGPDGFQPPECLGTEVNSEYNDYGPALAPDGKTLYFSSNRPRPDDARMPDPDAWPATVREDLFHRTYDLYSATIEGESIAAASFLQALNTPFNEGAPAVSPVGDFLYFASDRPAGRGGFDLYRSRRTGGTILPPTALGPEVNTTANELDPGLTMEGFALCFSSDRGQEDLAPSDRNYNLYITSSREVFVDFERMEVSPIDWAAWWQRVGPNLLWALLALLLLLTLLALMGALRNRKLSLLARCMLASLFLHILLMLLFNVWQVTTSLAGVFRGQGSTQVSLLSSAIGDEIVSQIRGPESETPSFEATMPEANRAETSPQATLPQVVVQLAPSTIAPPPEVHLEMHVASTDVQDTPIRLEQPPTIRAPQPQLNVALPESAPRPDADVVESKASVEVRPNPIPSSVRPALNPTTDGPSKPVVIAAPTLNQTDTPADSVAIRPVSLTEAQDAPVQPQGAEVMANAVAINSALASLEMGMPSERTEPIAHKTESSVQVTVSQERLAGTAPSRQAISPASAPIATSFAKVDLPPTDDAKPSKLANFAPPQLDAALPSVTALANPQNVAARPQVELATPDSEVPKSSTAPERVASIATPPPLEVKIDRPIHPSGTPQPTAYKRVDLPVERSKSIDDRNDSPLFDAMLPNLGASDRLLKADASSIAPLPLDPLVSADFRLPTEITPPENLFPQRAAENRKELIQRMGGSDATERAVAAALKWLAAHQSSNGSWSGSRFDQQCGQCGGETAIEVDSALTGLALLCFLGADHTHIKDGPYQKNVQRGIDWLMARQKPDGDLRGPETIYSQGIATIALSEAYGMTRDPKLERPVQRAVNFIAAARNREVGGWRYDPGQVGDTSVLGWQVMALKSAKSAGLEVPDDALEAARQWMALVSNPARPGRYVYQPGREITPAMTAEGMFIQLLLGLGTDDPATKASAEYIIQHAPDWDRSVNTYFWYYATLGLFHQQGPEWKRWNRKLTKELLEHQRTDEKAAGSWDPDGEWASTGGRVYQTALCTLMLEVYYRYLPLYAPSRPIDAIGAIRGRVIDAATQQGISGATVRLDIADGQPILATTAKDGSYQLDIPEVPAFFALSASAGGFTPEAANVTLSEVRGTTFVQDFPLQRTRSDVITLEAVPEVHHLGDNRFEGRINSQFQKQAEGDHFLAEFDVSEHVLSQGVTTAELRMLVKGVQRAHELRINGQPLAQRLDRAPDDGSFGEFVTEFPASLLEPGVNTFEIFAKALGGDVDDFEFVNVECRLVP